MRMRAQDLGKKQELAEGEKVKLFSEARKRPEKNL